MSNANNWRIAKSLLKLKDQINKKYPGRKTAWDGGIGDAAHASRSSDHNPWVKDAKGQPIVTAFDFTNDPTGGLDSGKVAQALLDSRDPRIKYIISNKRIASGSKGPQPWVWRKYTGKNPHDHHFHISVKETQDQFDAEQPWNLDGAPAAKDVKASPEAAAYVSPPPLILPGSKDKTNVKRMQTLLNAKGASIAVDGVYKKGGETEKALRKFQEKSNLAVDGKCGPASWSALMKL